MSHPINISEFEEFFNDDYNAAQEMKEKSLSVGTLKSYNSKLKCLKNYLEEKCPVFMEGDEIMLPLDKRILEAFLSHATKENGVSSVNGYVSAIKWYYNKRDIQMPIETMLSLKKVLGGSKEKLQI